MDLRDQETAAAVQDLEVRQMELEAQRKLLEQVGQPGEQCSCTRSTVLQHSSIHTATLMQN